MGRLYITSRCRHLALGKAAVCPLLVAARLSFDLVFTRTALMHRFSRSPCLLLAFLELNAPSDILISRFSEITDPLAAHKLSKMDQGDYAFNPCFFHDPR